MIAGNHRAERVKSFVPLSRVPERRDPMTELAQREFWIVLDVEMKINQTWNNRAPRQVDDLALWRQRNFSGWTNTKNAVAFDDDASALDRRLTTPVNHARVVEDNEPGLDRCAYGQRR